MLLEKHETFEKSAILGGFFKAYVQGKITLDDFRVFAFAIDRIYLDDLKSLAYQQLRSPLLALVPNSLKERLYPSGLISLKFTPELTIAKRQALTDQPSKLWFEINEKGKIFASILLEVIEIEEKDF